MTVPRLLELPPGVDLHYLAEGSANVVYRFILAPTNMGSLMRRRGDNDRNMRRHGQAGIPADLQGKLLRLRKEIKSRTPYLETARNFDSVIRPLFNSDELVDQTLVRLPPGLIQSCNERLRAAELTKSRPLKRHGVYLSVHETLGMLVTDMTTFNDPKFTLAELKPKWLLQSPTAPSMAQRCRTCALREMKNQEARLAGLEGQESFCPLDLVSDKFDNVLRATRYIKGCKDPVRLARILYRNNTLLKLYAHQKAMKDVGLWGPPAQTREMSLAMTLRDCTMFIKMPVDPKGPVEIRLGDLDLKSTAGGKASYWLDLETDLLRGGWYAGINPSQSPSECSLQELRQPFDRA